VIRLPSLRIVALSLAAFWAIVIFAGGRLAGAW
jgi:hypothetical protein